MKFLSLIFISLIGDLIEVSFFWSSLNWKLKLKMRFRSVFHRNNEKRVGLDPKTSIKFFNIFKSELIPVIIVEGLCEKWKNPEEDKQKIVAVSAVSIQGMIWTKSFLDNYNLFKLQRLLPLYQESPVSKSFHFHCSP